MPRFEIIRCYTGKIRYIVTAKDKEQAMVKYKANQESSNKYFMDVLHGNLKIKPVSVEVTKEIK